MKNKIIVFSSFIFALLMVSCSSAITTPQEVEGKMFTGEGIFGNIPYAYAHYESERAKHETYLAENHLKYTVEGNKADSAFSAEYYKTFKGFAEELEGKEVPFERCVGGKCEVLKGFTFAVEKSSSGYFARVMLKLNKPDGYLIGSEDRADHAIIALDKNDMAISLKRVGNTWIRYGLKVGTSAYKLTLKSNLDESINNLYFLDQVAKLVEVDKAALEKYAKKKQEAENKKLEEQAKANDLTKVQFSEKGYGPLTLQKSDKKIPQSLENFYTHYTLRTDRDRGQKEYSFYNGSELVAMLYADMQSHEIMQICIESEKISVKCSNGISIKADMPLNSVVKDFAGNCMIGCTPEDEGPSLSLCGSVKIRVTANDLTLTGEEKLNSVLDSFEYAEISSADISTDRPVSEILISY